MYVKFILLVNMLIKKILMKIEETIIVDKSFTVICLLVLTKKEREVIMY